MPAATICWGLAALLATQLPQVVSEPPKSGKKAAPAGPAAFQPVWTISLESIEQPHMVAGSTLLFVSSRNAPVSARALDDGHQVWALALQTELAPAVGEDLLFVATGDVVTAVEQATGRERWSARTGELALGPVWRSGWIFTAGSDGTIAGLRASDGSRVWEQKLDSPVSAPPAIDGDLLFAPLMDGRLVAIDISGGGNVRWTFPLGAAGTEPTAAAGRVFLSNVEGVLYNIKQETGRIDWPPHALIRSPIAGHAIVDESHVYMVTLDARVLGLDRGSGAILWWKGLPARPSEQIAIDSGQLLVPLQSGDISVRPATTGLPETLLATKLASGNRLVPPLVMTGTPGAPQLLRLTLGSDAVLTLASFKRAVPPPPVAKTR